MVCTGHKNTAFIAELQPPQTREHQKAKGEQKPEQFRPGLMCREADQRLQGFAPTHHGYRGFTRMAGTTGGEVQGEGASRRLHGPRSIYET